MRFDTPFVTFCNVAVVMSCRFVQIRADSCSINVNMLSGCICAGARPNPRAGPTTGSDLSGNWDHFPSVETAAARPKLPAGCCSTVEDWSEALSWLEAFRFRPG